MTFDYCYSAQLIAPQITADENGNLRLTGTLIINPRNTIETLIDKRVLLNVVETDNGRDNDRDCDCDHDHKRDCDKDKDKDNCRDANRQNNGNCNCIRR